MKAIAAALVKAQRAFGPALKTSANPHFKSRYADLAACVEAVIEGLNGAGIALIQQTHECDNGVTVETVFVHESGETFSAGKLHVPASKQDAQGYGSALTYARRYSLMAACGIAPEDDDGNAASRPAPPRQAPAKDDGYNAFEGKHLPILREAAMQGQAALQDAFKSIPKSDHKLKMWTLHQKNLKAACEVAA
jgi:hypothetical protein